MDGGEADGLGGVAEEASDGGVAGAGRFGDEKVRAVAFGDAVGALSERGGSGKPFQATACLQASAARPLACSGGGPLADRSENINPAPRCTTC